MELKDPYFDDRGWTANWGNPSNGIERSSHGSCVHNAMRYRNPSNGIESRFRSSRAGPASTRNPSNGIERDNAIVQGPNGRGVKPSNGIESIPVTPLRINNNVDQESIQWN